MRYSGLTVALIGICALCMTGCGTTRRATEVSSSRVQVSSEVEARDSLSEEISQNLEENVAEHEVVMWTVIQPQGDTVKVERVTERTKSRDGIATSKTKKETVRREVVRDTVYIERKDSVFVETTNSTNFTNGIQSGKTALHTTLKWAVALIIALCVLIIIVKVKR